MRIVWRDSVATKEYTYRGHVAKPFRGGWVIDLPGDNNIYYSIDCAHNAIDAALGGKTRRNATSRSIKGIRIIGKVS